MAYSDILNTTSLYGSLLSKNWANAGNKLNPSGFNDNYINPHSSAAYTPRSSRNIYNRPMEVTNEMEAFNDYDPWSTEGKVMQGMQGVQYGQFGSKMSPIVSDFGKGLTNTFQGKEWGTALTKEQLAGGYGEMGDLGGASAVYGLTQNQNPYDYTRTEHLGTMASTAMAAKAIAPMLGYGAASSAAPILGMNPWVLAASLIIGNMWSKKKKKKSEKMVKDAVGEFEDKQDEIYATRSEAVKDMREEMLSEQDSRMYEQRQDQYDNQYGGNYNDYRGDEGMKFSPKELNKIAKAGRNGDTQLAHINPQEAQMLKAMGGSGTINPYTGLREYNWLSDIMGGASDVLSTVGGVATDVLNPIFDTAGNLIDPVMGVATDVVNTAGGAVGEGVDFAADFAGGFARDVGPAIDSVARPVLEFGIDYISGLLGLFGGDDIKMNPYAEANPNINRDELTKNKNLPKEQKLSGLKQNKALGLEKRDKPTLTEGDWVGDKPNPYMAPNIEEEVDYANQGMKYKYATGGKPNMVAEFTGNELIVNDQNTVERGLANEDYSLAATPIRKAMQERKITPGNETHQGNPMPVDEQGNIYAGGGTLSFKVNKGAGIYDHATDQFKPNMTDKEIAMVAQDNINKWKSNKMYS